MFWVEIPHTQLEFGCLEGPQLELPQRGTRSCQGSRSIALSFFLGLGSRVVLSVGRRSAGAGPPLPSALAKKNLLVEMQSIKSAVWELKVLCLLYFKAFCSAYCCGIWTSSLP